MCKLQSLEEKWAFFDISVPYYLNSSSASTKAGNRLHPAFRAFIFGGRREPWDNNYRLLHAYNIDVAEDG